MAKTRHIHQRMNQRAISQQMLEIVKMFGVDDGDKTYLNKKGIDAALNEMNNLSKQMQKMRNRGGLVLVESGDVEITAYSLDSYDRKKTHSVH
ncbi:hypothetical protein [uncultured Pseudoalteromonas sp.]|uniref:hypothetical protein n=1 Tax=uncultured Pseudoalteromonas sp. TaxID=114053 RepID=UPI0025F20DD5|nr:hypothetical protein [uncultured Pseudoalteromonas sp.]|tara:strand:- start:29908 stop:30186 length:279 start_codon:yes stop_codon:yes gene_type:complete